MKTQKVMDTCVVKLIKKQNGLNREIQSKRNKTKQKRWNQTGKGQDIIKCDSYYCILSLFFNYFARNSQRSHFLYSHQIDKSYSKIDPHLDFHPQSKYNPAVMDVVWLVHPLLLLVKNQSMSMQSHVNTYKLHWFESCLVMK
eukprot:1143026_1